MCQSFNSTKREHGVTKNIHGILGLQTVRPTLHYNTTVHWYSDVLKHIYLQYTVVQYIVCHTVIAVNIYILYYNVKKR